ncbi:30S ribosomal protein S7 [Candidatus Kuenenbacteria bacterium CG_4_9_14_3_um_filter_39_14]|uniref:Small ribosomal subunit protein uS7 n=5 Tax=Candidatus Kueneniibacteriota TaxID=1752740 RepID=A0A2M7IL34_9BACT|nr:30S ribosomal protein S7 [Candidatus Kuenenbacteria bacterium]OIP55897.1 MAG: 30S ribosomal protein S7 [Candidatus Kuenenbacteria bacterium CG2_30_39_24]PIP29113.1 MAG: 30S ribosomal protein S7 [Candidatus Kuenenbacteria bacterium CG23_combo_of_CG06-09_8_20_14_all_39_39]PIW95559.1 MAG: 30S ribosomal protein S7 [Candidatus Kuenenbacteria bacterium CG_4_8_14_3_um_filter_39_15]PIX92357.1 MAG: 30S ribosomal protein S7 [Candidatus Kuenenbacteria bacterium CG_4_10_14_3_um_filter_39_14]PJA91682.1 
MRGKAIPKRRIKPDPKYNRLDIAKLTNYIMRRGKKTIAQKIVYRAFDIISEQTKKDPFEIYNKALRNVGPSLEIRGRRIGGANYQIPFPVADNRRQILAFRWLIIAAKGRRGKPMAEALALELMDAAKGEGAAVKKREDTSRMAEANKAFAHFARFTKRKR